MILTYAYKEKKLMIKQESKYNIQKYVNIYFFFYSNSMIKKKSRKWKEIGFINAYIIK